MGHTILLTLGSIVLILIIIILLIVLVYAVLVLRFLHGAMKFLQRKAHRVAAIASLDTAALVRFAKSFFRDKKSGRK
jgi:hypothetical protein